jgi:hypothetical protein
VNPPPLPHDEAFCCDQVRDMLLGPLNRNIVEIQPTLFGVGLFQMSGPNAANALVQHGPYPLSPLHLNRSVRFIHADDAVNHRASQCFRNGWLMLLGILPDYRNGLHIANAVSSFGKFHSWNSMDPIECRALVFALFQSPAHVPRDVVFGKFASVGGVRETWTVLVCILTADFAGALPGDEDQMPPNGNPHPLPGNLQFNNNLFVMPQFPEIGWDAVQDNAGAQQHNVHDHIVFPEHADPMVKGDNVDQESMVLDASDSSGSSVNMLDMVLYGHNPPQNQNNILQVEMMQHRMGPVLPPEMQWCKLFESMMPLLMTKDIPLSLQSVSFNWVKRSWTAAFDDNTTWKIQLGTVEEP